MEEEIFNKYNQLSTNLKREILIQDMLDTIKVLEKLARKRKIKINELQSAYIINNPDKILEEDFYKLMYIYLFYLKEDLGNLL